VNRAIDWTRARAARAEVFTTPERGEDPRGQEASGELLAALAALAPDQRAVVVLRYLLEYTPGEIAGMLDLPRGTVNSRLRRALDALGTRLERER
jgi:RNA polymerase sigma-70 factor (ECF subfamily)